MDLLDDRLVGGVELSLLAFGRRLPRTTEREEGQTYEYERGQKPQ